MLPSLRVLLLAHDYHVRRFRLPATPCDEVRLMEALREAAALAEDRKENEPAAILFALTCRPRALGDHRVWEAFPLLLAERHARHVGFALRLDPDDVPLELLRLRVLRGDAPFEEIRRWIAERLQPLG